MRTGKITRQELSAGMRAELDAVDTKDTDTLNAAKTYADGVSASAESAANNYSDDVGTTTLSSAISAAESRDTTTLNSAKAYADSVGSSTLNSAEGYADGAVSSKFVKGSLSTNNSSWVASGNAELPYKKNIAISGVTTSDVPSVAFNNATYAIARGADMAYVETYNGGITLYAGVVPSGTVTFDYLITKG